MRRNLLRSEVQDAQNSRSIDTTPLRGDFIRLPRSRLWERNFNSEDILKNPTLSCHETIKPFSQIVRTYPFKLPNETYAGDRFIPSRRGYNIDAANYILTKRSVDTSKKYQLDVLKQVEFLSTKWRKKFMHQLMEEENVIPGLRQKQVLRGSHLSAENKSSGNFAEHYKDPWTDECCEDGMWKSKPRKRPLIGTMESILGMPGFQTSRRRRLSKLIDWSSSNMIAAVIQDSLIFYDTCTSQTLVQRQNFDATNVCLLKWNNSGDKLVICTMSSELKLYDVSRQKIMWTQQCTCKIVYDTSCYIRCVCWSKYDQHIVTGCEGVISIYRAYDGDYIRSLHVHALEILALAFSKDYHYLSSSSLDVDTHIFFWPTMTPVVHICSYEPAKAIAWHPHDSNLLCIGGGNGDASLMLCNIKKINRMSYRLVNFHGIVENIAWNKISGELVVHWSYQEDQNRYNVIPVLTSLDHIVDVVPIDKKSNVNTILWNHDHTQIAVQSEESLTVWNFFGNEYQYRLKSKKPREIREIKKNTRITNYRELKYFSIR